MTDNAAPLRAIDTETGSVSEVHRQLHAKCPPILLNRIFGILRPPWIEIFLIQQIVNARGQIEMLAEGMRQRRRVKNAEPADRISRKSRHRTGVLRIDACNQSLPYDWYRHV